MHPTSPKTLSDLQWPKILEALAHRAKIDLGKARCLARPFFDDPEAVRSELSRIAELQRLSVEERLALPSWGVTDIRPQVDRASKGGILEPPELLAAANVLHAMLRLRDFVESRASRMPRAWAVAERICELGRLATRIEKSFEPSGELSDRASPDLYELRERARGLHRSIKAKLDQMLHDERFTSLLRENYFTIRNERYVVPVVVANRSQVPGIVHNASQSGQTLFVEPQPLIGLGNELAIAQSMVQEEERRILAELSKLLGDQGPSIADSLMACAELDEVEAAAKLGLDLGAHPAEPVGAEDPFRLSAMRHPLLALQEQKYVVPNDVEFLPGIRVLVVSGPNAGGKTVTLTGVGLCALMLRAGLPIPAEPGSTLPIFARLESAVGDKQDISRDLSTFSAHLTALKEIGSTAGPGTLVLIDEIAADTDPREGAAIALAVLEDLADKGARSIVTTHLEELKAVAVTDPRYVNARVGFDPGRMAPTYKLQYGTPGSSSAIEIARRVGLPKAICDKAEENLKTTAGPLGRALTALDEARARLAAESERFEAERKAIEKERADLQAAKARVAERERAIEAEARKDLVADIDQARAEVAALLTRLQVQPTIKAAVEAQAKLADKALGHQKRVDKSEAEGKSRDERMPAGTAITAGMRVRVPALGEAQVLEVSGDEALVQAGVMKVRQKVKDLVPLKGASKQPAKFPGKKDKDERLKAAEKMGAGDIDYGGNRLDVRGMRGDEAIRALEGFLDRSYGEGRPGALIVHGLGTGALQATIRDYLRGSPYAKAFRRGADHEGGDGVTVVDLRG